MVVQKGVGVVFVYGSIILSSILAGCLATEGPAPAPGEPAEVPISFEWIPPEAPYAFLLRYQVDPGNTSCLLQGYQNGTLDDPSGIGVYYVLHQVQNETWTNGTGTVSRVEGSVHVGDVNTARLTGPLYQGNFKTGWSIEASGGTSGYVMTAGFSMSSEAPHKLRVQCDGADAAFRFMVADELVAVHSTTSTGGVGVATESDDLHVNRGDDFVIDTQGNDVRLMLSSESVPPRVGGPFVEGGIKVHGPSGEESVPLESDPESSYSERRSWNEAGAYEVTLDRIAYGRSHLLGVLAGFVIEHEVGAGWQDS